MNNSSNSAQAQNKQRASADSGACATNVYQQMEEAVEDRPMSAVMLSFGVGLGVGLAIGSMLISSPAQREPHKRMAERMGQQFLDAFNKIVPNAISDRFNG